MSPYKLDRMTSHRCNSILKKKTLFTSIWSRNEIVVKSEAFVPRLVRSQCLRMTLLSKLRIRNYCDGLSFVLVLSSFLHLFMSRPSGSANVKCVVAYTCRWSRVCWARLEFSSVSTRSRVVEYFKVEQNNLNTNE